MRQSRGFSLIELMIVIAIISILAAMAVPAYSRYVARSRVSEVFGMLDSIKPRIVEYHGANQGSGGGFPPLTSTSDVLGLTGINTAYMNSLAITASNTTSAQLTATLNGAAFGFTNSVQLYLVITAPTTPNGTYSTTCYAYAAPSYMSYVPASCTQDPNSPASP